MNHIAVVGFPELSAEDQEWIEGIRASHDPQAGRLPVHVTFVFPCRTAPGPVIAEMIAVAAAMGPVSFRVTAVDAVADATGGGAHVFFMPDDEASGAIAALHDRLYEGELRPHLRTDLAFIPHLTVAAAGSLAECRALADAFRERGGRVRGTVAEIALLDIATSPATTLSRCRLSGGAGRPGCRP